MIGQSGREVSIHAQQLGHVKSAPPCHNQSLQQGLKVMLPPRKFLVQKHLRIRELCHQIIARPTALGDMHIVVTWEEALSLGMKSRNGVEESGFG